MGSRSSPSSTATTTAGATCRWLVAHTPHGEMSQAGGDGQPSGGSRVLLDAVNGVEALAVGVLHIARGVLVTAITGATDLTVQAVSVATGVARGAVGVTARLGGEVVGLATAAAQAATGTGPMPPPRGAGARSRHRERRYRREAPGGLGRPCRARFPWRPPGRPARFKPCEALRTRQRSASSGAASSDALIVPVGPLVPARRAGEPDRAVLGAPGCRPAPPP
jgi:hypothetical protein